MNLKELAQYLISQKDRIHSKKAVTGLDGFVDEMITVVGERRTLDDFQRVEDISRFGDLIKQAAGQSSLREIVLTAVHPGGCAVNMGDGMASIGLNVETFATLGNPVHSAFTEYGKRAVLHSWGSEPGRTLAFEFADGKLMFSAVAQLVEIDTGLVSEELAKGDFEKACREAALVALTDWTLYPHMTEVWRLLNDSVFVSLEDSPWLFIDLVDPSSRSIADIKGMLKVLGEFSKNMRVVLGLNRNEANILCRILEIDTGKADDKTEMMSQAQRLREVLGVEQVVIHAHASAACATVNGAFSVDGPYCPNPRKSTGAGDRFNAGFALGLILDVTPEECLKVAVSSSGFFVREAKSASLEELADFMDRWSKDQLDA